MTFVTAGLVERAGRCLLLMVSAGGMAFSSFLVSFSFYFKDIGRGHLPPGLITFINLLALFSLLVYVMTFSLGVGASPMDSNGRGSFWIFSAVCAINVIFVALIVPETHGHTLEQIAASFK